jgi:Ala-tRNA(Pro) deacylase
MPVRQVKEFLDNRNVKYVAITHSTAYTALEIASMAHVKGKDFAKAVVVIIDGVMVMAVLPASFQVDLPLLKAAAKGKTIALASEAQFTHRFPGCEAGAIPPLGPLFGMPMFVEETLTKDKEIAFSAGTHHELIRLAYADFESLVHPQIASFAIFAEPALRL